MSEGSSRGVLVVEDQADLKDLLVFLLETEHFRVFEAGDGKAALDILRAEAPMIDLLITDLGLPTVGSMDLITSARQLKPSMRILGISGLGGESMKEAVLQAGADGFIAKPFTGQAVLTMIKSLMENA